MPSTSRRAPRQRFGQHPVFATGALALVLAMIVMGIWVRGGFSTDAAPYLGPRVEVGEPIETRWWDVAVHEGWSTPDDGKIHLALTATNKQAESTFDLTTNMVVVRLPSGEPMLRSSCRSERGGLFGPLIPAEAVCTFGYEDNELASDAIPTEDEFTVEVIVLDQKYSNDLVTDPEPVAGEPAGWLPIEVSPVVEETP